jgi:hypothetical protein
MRLVTVLGATVIAGGLALVFRRRESRVVHACGVAAGTLALVQLALRYGGMPRFLSVDLDAAMIGAGALLLAIAIARAKVKAIAVAPLVAALLWLLVETGWIRELT